MLKLKKFIIHDGMRALGENELTAIMGEHRVHDTDSLLHEFLLVFHKSCVIRVHQLIAYVKSQEVCIPLYRRMRQMDKDGKKMVAEFAYRHAV